MRVMHATALAALVLLGGCLKAPGGGGSAASPSNAAMPVTNAAAPAPLPPAADTTITQNDLPLLHDGYWSNSQVENGAPATTSYRCRSGERPRSPNARAHA